MSNSNRTGIKGIVNLYRFFHFYFSNTDFSVVINIIDLEFSMCILKVPIEESMSQIFYLSPSFFFISKIG